MCSAKEITDGVYVVNIDKHDESGAHCIAC